MSFSGMVKEELSGHTDARLHCNISELAAVLSACGHMEVMSNGSKKIRIQTENELVARKSFTLLEKTFNIETAISVRESSYIKRGYVYLMEITDPHGIQALLEATSLSPEGNSGGMLILKDLGIASQVCCKRAFIRGAFLSSGSISNPEKSYHFEVVYPDEIKAMQLQEIIRSFHIDAKIVLRKKSYVVYVKEGAQIVDILAIMGAETSLASLKSIRSVKEVRNSVNRKVNCETANINKTVNAAVKQMEDIKFIEKTIGFQSLNEGLSQIAVLRLQYPEATLKELGMMLSPQVGKSGVNHRLRKLSSIADDLRENKEELL